MATKFVLLSIAALAASGCLRAKRPVTTSFQPATGASVSVPVAAEQVVVVERADGLPDGLRWDPTAGARPGQRLVIEPDFQHVLIGAVGVREGDPVGHDALVAAARVEAGSRGANLIYILDQRHDIVTALAVRVSPATPRNHFASASELLQQHPDKLAGYEPSGVPIDVDLATLAPLTVPAQRGQCFGVQVALERDARWNPALQTASVTRTDARKVMATNSLGPTLARRARAVAGVAGCQLVDGPLEIAIGPGRAIGTGAAKVQLYVRTIDAAEIAKRRAAEDQGFAEAAAREREAVARDCKKCFPLLTQCARPDQPSSCRAYTSCLARLSVRVDQCGR